MRVLWRKWCQKRSLTQDPITIYLWSVWNCLACKYQVFIYIPFGLRLGFHCGRTWVKGFRKTFLESFFVGPLIPLFWTSGDVCPGFQSPSGFPHLFASFLCAVESDSPLVWPLLTSGRPAWCSHNMQEHGKGVEGSFLDVKSYINVNYKTVWRILFLNHSYDQQW